MRPKHRHGLGALAGLTRKRGQDNQHNERTTKMTEPTEWEPQEEITPPPTYNDVWAGNADTDKFWSK